ncbi:DUF1838 domain-containing protein [Biformimicrobium ophioploci]|uniref:DUF1838 domain-containing protein n=1 Tax=Biformimicrobium ophioploci TaxID=3036711 RepID=A0ABQ6LW75_9GAMM|nr:DUF1838 domain-containing protein [Microbulbifer sp. NKW57]
MQAPVASPALDFSTPADNLYAFGKLWATYADEPVFSAFHGLMYGLVGNTRAKPLFGYCGFGQFQARLLDNGNVRLRGKETGYFYDPASGDILRDWLNPYTGERVEVYNFLNDRIRGELGPVMPRFQMGDGEDAPTLMNEGTAIVNEDGSVPFILPWQTFGDNLMLEWDYTHRYRNPVTPELWPKASTGPYINPSEHFTFSSPLKEISDRDTPSASFSCGFSRLSPWWPWMKMGQSGIDGVLFGRMNSHKSNQGLVDVPRKVLDYTERYHPEYLEPCTDWDDGFPIGTWEAYARDVAPEVKPEHST